MDLVDGLVTVVIPIYNVEPYLERCIKSVINQTYSNLEVILVDDGSPDKCPQLCDEWALRDSRIKVVHKKNAGLGMARNTGIDNATGEYICFFDSDDYVALDTIEKTYTMAKTEQLDVVCFGCTSIRNDGTIRSVSIPNSPQSIYRDDTVQKKFLPNLIAYNAETGENWNLQMSACMALFSMRMIKKVNWRFVSEREIISEDIYSILILYQYVKSVAALPEALYYYCQNMESLTQTFHQARYGRIKIFHEKCLELIETGNYDIEVRRRIYSPYLSNTIAHMKQIVMCNCTQKLKSKN